MKKPFDVDLINQEMKIFDPAGIHRPDEKRYWPATPSIIPYPIGWEPGVRVHLPGRGDGTIANYENIKRCMERYGGHDGAPRKYGEIPIVFDDDKTGFYWFEPKAPLKRIGNEKEESNERSPR